MRYNELQAHAFGVILIFGVFDNRFKIFGFSLSEIMAADGVTVFFVAVNLILAAVKNDSPDVPYSEREVGKSVTGGGVVCYFLGIYSSGVVVSARKDNGNFAFCNE